LRLENHILIEGEKRGAHFRLREKGKNLRKGNFSAVSPAGISNLGVKGRDGTLSEGKKETKIPEKNVFRGIIFAIARCRISV